MRLVGRREPGADLRQARSVFLVPLRATGVGPVRSRGFRGRTTAIAVRALGNSGISEFGRSGVGFRAITEVVVRRTATEALVIFSAVVRAVIAALLAQVHRVSCGLAVLWGASASPGGRGLNLPCFLSKGCYHFSGSLGRLLKGEL